MVARKHPLKPIPIQVQAKEDRDEATSDALFYSIGEGAIVIDERGNISRINRIACDILGFAAKDLIGKWYPSMVKTQDEAGREIPNLELPITEAFLSGKPVSRRVYFRKKDGKPVPVSLNVAPIIVNGLPVGAIELFQDITEDIQLERAKDEFISIASHQLRTPATIVKQNLGMIIEGYVQSDEQQAELVRTAYEHNDNQLHIINDLLNIAQAEARQLKPKLEPIDLLALLRKIIKNQKPAYAKRNMELNIETFEDEVMICADPLHLQMVFENLIHNALKYSRPGTTVAVAVSCNPDKATIDVIDQGFGIAAKDINRLFRKFSRVENISSTASGTGLGLYWAKELVELHNGTISVTSKLHKGTTFTVVLPRGA